MPALFVTFRTLWRTLRRAWQRPEFRGLATMTLAVIALGTGFYWWREPTITNPLDALYFTIITLSTIGYGDFSPTTPLTKLFTIVYIFVGLAILAAFIAMIGEQVLQDASERAHKQAKTGEEDE